MQGRGLPSVSREMNCTLTISGEEEEVVRAATEYTVSVHGHTDSPQLREDIVKFLGDEVPAYA